MDPTSEPVNNMDPKSEPADNKDPKSEPETTERNLNAEWDLFNCDQLGISVEQYAKDFRRLTEECGFQHEGTGAAILVGLFYHKLTDRIKDCLDNDPAVAKRNVVAQHKFFTCQQGDTSVKSYFRRFMDLMIECGFKMHGTSNPILAALFYYGLSEQIKDRMDLEGGPMSRLESLIGQALHFDDGRTTREAARRKYRAERELFTLRQDGIPVAEYIARFRRLIIECRINKTKNNDVLMILFFHHLSLRIQESVAEEGRETTIDGLMVQALDHSLRLWDASRPRQEEHDPFDPYLCGFNYDLEQELVDTHQNTTTTIVFIMQFRLCFHKLGIDTVANNDILIFLFYHHLTNRIRSSLDIEGRKRDLEEFREQAKRVGCWVERELRPATRNRM